MKKIFTISLEGLKGEHSGANIIIDSLLGKTLMEIIVAHSGNEIGVFYDKIENLDAIAMGPTREKFHTPNEVLSIAFTRNHYKLLLNSLSSL